MKEEFYPSSNINPQQLEAWKTIIPTLQRSYNEIVVVLIHLGGSATVREISERLDKQLHQVSGRITELRKKKIICDSGMVRHSVHTRRNMTVWSLNSENALKWMNENINNQ